MALKAKNALRDQVNLNKNQERDAILSGHLLSDLSDDMALRLVLSAWFYRGRCLLYLIFGQRWQNVADSYLPAGRGWGTTPPAPTNRSRRNAVTGL